MSFSDKYFCCGIGIFIVLFQKMRLFFFKKNRVSWSGKAAATRRPHAAPPASPAFCADCRLLGGFASCSSAATSQMFSLKCCERASRCFCWLINQQINDFYCRLVSSVLSQYVNRMKRKHNFISTDLYSE